ncbi:MAG: hypothetical protein CVV64_17120 [Candidatus Wallbacteria bacterium HGW-Wallbacteria-1]|jgi:hypothetical protein|uniref:Uncharacterized protein n=1 Tax=Candidatus Wallbacteria bacterium HGW-Wallbacteria-1 TaxID=2013854 RepID=A0A2N1PKE6_9BACT|nr:MAG: hypothetical protein CVV64_17120 [Candidatus Wallbacteria bacterium HGW-Wallbacteria-1]
MDQKDIDNRKIIVSDYRIPSTYWNTFIALEADLERITRFIEFNEDNFQCYSIELTKIILATCSEIDVIAKLLCEKIDPDFQNRKIKNITYYHEILSKKYPSIGEYGINLFRYGLEIFPWKDWNSDIGPVWWRSYNDLKHERNNFFKTGNLENALFSTSGLFVLVLLYYCEFQAMEPVPKLFFPPKKIASISFSCGGPVLVWFNR